MWLIKHILLNYLNLKSVQHRYRVHQFLENLLLISY